MISVLTFNILSCGDDEEFERATDERDIRNHIQNKYNWNVSYGSSQVISIDEINFTSETTATAEVTLRTCGTFRDPRTGRSYTNCSSKKVSINMKKSDGEWVKT